MATGGRTTGLPTGGPAGNRSIDRTLQGQPMTAQAASGRRQAAPEPPSRIPRPPGSAGRDGPIAGAVISRPTQIPQWPLAGPPVPAPPSSIPKPVYQPPPGRSQPPQRPPRPSRVPSILDGSKIQDPTPVFQYTPQTGRESELSVPQSTTSSTSRPSTIDSVGSIPDFPLPVTATPAAAVPPRRSVNLGPPPSARRGASSFYSNASFVSPIPEESPRSRSRASYASSAAMPMDSWSSNSPGPSPEFPESPDGRFDDALREESRDLGYGEEHGDESQLVRSASVGKRGKALLVTTPAPQRSSEIAEMGIRPVASPIQPSGPFKDGTGFVDASSTSSSSLPKTGPTPPVGQALTADSILNAYDAATASDPSNPNRRLSVSPQPSRGYSRLSAIRRPPRLDIDAVRTAEARGSLTSLPDLIRRATRLAASLEKGRRPASRFDDMDQYPYPPAANIPQRENLGELEKHQSGLSDMLAAFPPPAQPLPQPEANRRSFRQSLRDGVNSWPLPPRFSTSRTRPSPLSGEETVSNSNQSSEKPGRRCCGLPLWGFVILMIVLIIVITAAVVIPVEFFVLRRANTASAAQPSLSDCQSQLKCQNGGTNFVTAEGTCSCICTGGFTGANCTIPGANGCTTTNIVDQSSTTGSNTINNVTLGDSVPRLIQNAQLNFSIPISATQILAKFNAASLSCAAENALITFNGRSIRLGEGTSEVTATSSSRNAGAVGVQNVQIGDGMAVATVTVVVDAPAANTLARRVNGAREVTVEGLAATLTGPTTLKTTLDSVPPTTTTTTVTVTSTRPVTTATATVEPTSSTRSTTSSTSTTLATSTPIATFPVTEEVLDFARISVLFVLQQETLQNAETAQLALQSFFTASSSTKSTTATIEQARNLTLGNGNSINLVNFLVDVGSGPVGKGSTPLRALVVRAPEAEPTFESRDLRPPPLLRFARR